MRPIRIAQVAPPIESVPPKLYGGTERVVHWLTEELVRRGHDVTLFATADSQSTARVVPIAPRAVRLSPTVVDPYVYVMRAMGLVFDRASDFDVIHCHVDYFHLPFTRLVRTPTVLTLHGRLDIPDLPFIFDEYPEAPLISISHSQRRPLPDANWVATVHHGLPIENFSPGAGGDYLAFLGRISPEKGIDTAIAVARTVGLPLKIAAKVDRADRDYFETKIKPLLREPGVEYLGEVDEREKNQLLAGAKAMLFPIRWPEPFGIVVVEALACGTPVITFDQGSMPEILIDGETGFICQSPAEMVTAVGRIDQIDRNICRRHAESRFSVGVMVDHYEAAYERVIAATSLSVPIRPVRRVATLAQPPFAAESVPDSHFDANGATDGHNGAAFKYEG